MAENRFSVDSDFFSSLSDDRQSELNSKIESCVQSRKREGDDESQAIATCKNSIVNSMKKGESIRNAE